MTGFPWNDENTEEIRRLYWIEEHSVHSIAQVFGVTPSAVTARLQRAFKTVKRKTIPLPVQTAKHSERPKREYSHKGKPSKRYAVVGDVRPGEWGPDCSVPKFAHHKEHVDAVMDQGGFLRWSTNPHDGRPIFPLRDANNIAVDQHGEPLPKRHISR